MADSSKTEEATPKKRLKAREQGQIARSRELPGILAFAAVMAVMVLMAPTAITHWGVLYRNTLYAAASGDIDPNGPVLFWSAFEVMRWIVPALLAGMALSILSGLAQGGVNFAPEALAWKVNRLSPVSKLGQLFSAMGLSNLLKSLLPFSAMMWIVVTVMRNHWGAMVNASSLGSRMFIHFVASMAFELTWKSGLVLVAWSAVDYLLTMRKINSDLRMSKQEVQEEYKETDGNPVIKSRIRQLQRAMRRRKSLAAAATATVVVTNPTHFAIALRYETDMPAPIVVAKGRNLLAEKIKQLARENGIMLVENRPLAHALYKSVEVGDAIPAKLYQAVAEILALVFRAQAEVRRSDAERRSRNASGQRTESSTTSSAQRPGVTS